MRRWLSVVLTGSGSPAVTSLGTVTAGDMLLDYLRQATAALLRQEAEVRRGGDDAVHQLRVATRRLRSALGSFRRLLDRGETNGFAIELRWLAGRFAPARDLEVQYELLKGQLAALAPELRIGRPDRFLDGYFAERSEAAAQIALAAIDSARYHALLRAADRLLASPPLTERAGDPAEDGMRYTVRRSQRRLATAVARVRLVDIGVEWDEALHEVRKKAKQARYTAEVCAPVGGKALRQWGKAAKDMQSALGDHQDASVARAMLLRLATAAAQAGRDSFSYGVLYAHNATHAATASASLADSWQELLAARPAWLR